MKYLFTDTDLAAQRLQYLADVFAPTMRTFILAILDQVKVRPQLVLDLGCGPGYTTHFLARLTQGERVIGLDNSAHFISLAKQTLTYQISFHHHDLTTIPFPVGPSDFIYSRYLLTHLSDPAGVINQWGTQLQAEGLLLIEETESIQTSNLVFRIYLEIVEAMLAAQANQLYLGASLDILQETECLSQQSSQVDYLPVLNHQAATMFYMNIQAWKSQPFIQANYNPEMINELEVALEALASQVNDTSQITWALRQIVFARKALPLKDQAFQVPLKDEDKAGKTI